MEGVSHWGQAILQFWFWMVSTRPWFTCISWQQRNPPSVGPQLPIRVLIGRVGSGNARIRDWPEITRGKKIWFRVQPGLLHGLTEKTEKTRLFCCCSVIDCQSVKFTEWTHFCRSADSAHPINFAQQIPQLETNKTFFRFPSSPFRRRCETNWVCRPSSPNRWQNHFASCRHEQNVWRFTLPCVLSHFQPNLARLAERVSLVRPRFQILSDICLVSKLDTIPDRQIYATKKFLTVTRTYRSVLDIIR